MDTYCRVTGRMLCPIGRIAQLARALPLQGRCRGFESLCAHQTEPRVPRQDLWLSTERRRFRGVPAFTPPRELVSFVRPWGSTWVGPDTYLRDGTLANAEGAMRLGTQGLFDEKCRREAFSNVSAKRFSGSRVTVRTHNEPLS